RDDLAVRRRGEVVVKGRDDLLGVQAAVAVEVAEQLFLLGVDTEHGVGRIQVFLLQPGDVLELGIALLMLPHGLGLAGLAANIMMLAQQLADDPSTDAQAALAEAVGGLLVGQVGPADCGAHGVAGGVLFQDVEEGGVEFGEEVAAAPASTPFFRTRWGCGSGRCSSSSTPRRTVLGSRPKSWAMYSWPPWPSLV